jgi:hypothetical protein
MPQPLSYECAGSGYFRRIVYRLHWTTNTHFYLEQQPGGYCFGGTALYSGDIVQANSLTRFMYTDSATLFENGSYFWTEYQWESELMTPQQFAQDCAVREYNLETDHFYLHFIPGVCGLGESIPDGSGDRLYEENYSGRTQYDVLRFNPHTARVQTIFSGDPVQIWDVSSDGHYLVFFIINDAGRYLAILDLQTGTIIHTGITHEDFALPSWNHDSRRLLFWSSSVPSVLNMETGEVIDITLPSTIPLERYSAEWLDDGTLRIAMGQGNTWDEDWIVQSAEWIVQVP